MNRESRAIRVRTIIVAVSALTLVLAAGAAAADPWRFGIMSDTQWKANLDGENPETVAVGIIKQLNQQFIHQGVKFVVQVGDLVDKETDSTNGLPANRTMDTRAEAAQPLYDAGICFFPLRGNHESSADAAWELPVLFPQTTGNGMTCGATNFTSPSELLEGLSYSFDYGNARFVLLDQFTRPDGSSVNGTSDDNMLDQMDWFENLLGTKGGDSHGFVFSHKNLMGANHADILFGSNPTANPEAQNRFFGSMYDNGAHYHFGGHDHNHTRSIIVSPDHQSSIQDIITSSNSYKFYTPDIPSHDQDYNNPLRETPIVQELYTVGYYIVTVDGPRVSVDHYASAVCGQTLGATESCSLASTPDLDFHKRETFGYSLNGQEFLVAQGGSYGVVHDSFAGTTAEILDGVNGSTTALYDGRPTTKAVDTGWTPKSGSGLASHILTLWGMGELGSEQTDTFVLSMSYDKKPIHQGNGGFGIATRDGDGNWVNAVDMNYGGAKTFVHGPWQPGYGLGTYGIDPSSKTVWAVVNYNGDFAVARDIEAVPGHRK